MIRHLPEHKRNEFELLGRTEERTVRGDQAEGRRPYVELDGQKYRNDVLAQSYGLISKVLRLIVNEQDYRTVKAFLPNGAELGILRAPGYWGITPHSRADRRAINSLVHKRTLFYTESDDPIHVYLDYLASQTTKETKGKSSENRPRRSANQIAKTQKAAGVDVARDKLNVGSSPTTTKDLVETKFRNTNLKTAFFDRGTDRS